MKLSVLLLRGDSAGFVLSGVHYQYSFKYGVKCVCVSVINLQVIFADLVLICGIFPIYFMCFPFLFVLMMFMVSVIVSLSVSSVYIWVEYPSCCYFF